MHNQRSNIVEYNYGQESFTSIKMLQLKKKKQKINPWVYSTHFYTFLEETTKRLG